MKTSTEVTTGHTKKTLPLAHTTVELVHLCYKHDKVILVFMIRKNKEPVLWIKVSHKRHHKKNNLVKFFSSIKIEANAAFYINSLNCISTHTKRLLWGAALMANAVVRVLAQELIIGVSWWILGREAVTDSSCIYELQCQFSLVSLLNCCCCCIRISAIPL